MGVFRIKGSLTGPTGHKEEVEFLVDTGATLVVVPQPLAERLGLTPNRSQRIVIAGGQRETSPVAEVRLALDGQKTTTPCFISPAGPPLLGAVALESLVLAVDPVANRLIPVEGFVGYPASALSDSSPSSRLSRNARL
ncbi:MAG: aspartyl protease family protein [Deltaproteobacteria bacterium]|nr:aspartyl protease family protein [Deltaproteobacteria bacterium]